MKVRATKEYFDKTLNKLITAGTEINVTEDRAKVLTSAGVAEIIAETTPTTEKVARKKKNEQA